MKKQLVLVALLGSLFASASFAALKPGDRAPDLNAQASLGPQYADRVSYVISRDGRILYAYQSLNPEKHVANTLDALRKWSEQRKY